MNVIRSLRCFYIEEPELIFGNEGRSIDPKAGIMAFGPYHLPSQKTPRPEKITLGIIGDKKAVELAREWLERCKHQIKGKPDNPYLFPDFPGFNRENTFRCELEVPEFLIRIIKEDEIKKVVKIPDIHERIYEAAQLYVNEVESLSQIHPPPDVIICAVSEIIEKKCDVKGARIPRFTKTDRQVHEIKKMGQAFLHDFGIGEEPRIKKSYDFRRAVKGRSMKFGIPLQLIRYSTLKERRKLEDPATRAWNFSVALYYKAGGYPWKLADIDSNTCYVGISFYREKLTPETNLYTAIAQIFTVYGEGIVLRGGNAILKEDRQPHLSEESSYKLLKNCIETYRKQIGDRPHRITVHKSSSYTHEELEGFKSAIEEYNIPYWSLVTIRETGIRIFRQNKRYPVFRGTFIKLADNNYLLYTTGFALYLRTYPGPNVPSPLWISEIHGDEDPLRIAREILALTKMNWNNMRFYNKFPVTLQFAKFVGQILSELEPNQTIQSSFKFYM